MNQFIKDKRFEVFQNTIRVFRDLDVNWLDQVSDLTI